MAEAQQEDTDAGPVDEGSTGTGPTGTGLTLPTAPELADALKEVWGAGGWPLAALFVVALFGVLAVGGGWVTEATTTILYLAIFLAGGSFATFLLLTVLGYLRWKEELRAHREIFRAETELQDSFILQLVEYASSVGRGMDNYRASDREADIKALAGSIGGLIREVTHARNDLRRLPGASAGSSPTSAAPVPPGAPGDP